MNDSLKKRLIGAVVLIAMAVIFIPMLLSGPDPNGMPALGSNVPPSPNYKFKTVEIPLQVPAASDGEQAMTVESQSPESTPAAAPEPAAATPPVATTPPPKPVTAPAPAPVKPAPTPAKAVAPIAAPQGPKAWVVQLGSFSSQNNAFTLRDKLRKAGFTAFVEKVASGKENVYRVRVGPESSRERADALRVKLSRQVGLKGLVMHYP